MTKEVTHTVSLTPLFWVGVVSIILKLTPVNDWPWGVVLIPFYPIILLMAFVYGTFVFIYLNRDRLNWKITGPGKMERK